MDDLDNLFFDHRVQKKARVEPLFVSQKKKPCYQEAPTFDGFLPTIGLHNDLSSFKLSQLMSQTQSREPWSDEALCQVTEGSQFGKEKRKPFNLSQATLGKRLSCEPAVVRKAKLFKPPLLPGLTTTTGRPVSPPGSPEYASDEDLFIDHTQSRRYDHTQLRLSDCNQSQRIHQTQPRLSDCNQSQRTHQTQPRLSDCNQSQRIHQTQPRLSDCNQSQRTHQTQPRLSVPSQPDVSRQKSFDYRTPQPLAIPDLGCGKAGQQTKLRSVEEIPQRYREIFNFPYFNIVQSLVLDDVLYTDKPMVVCAPTGSGKTAVFELAILRLLMTAAAQNIGQIKIIYMAPIKALCSERFLDWQQKFEPFGLRCKELTGDTEMEDYFQLQEVNIVTTTPEKWDSMTRKWRDNKSLVQMVRLFLIDEVHVLNDDTRGATMEAVISRMKTVQSALSWSNQPAVSMRFIAASATIPNIEDIAQWLGSGEDSAVFHSLGDEYRPVRLRRVVLGYFCSEESSDFKFDISLNYKIANIIQTYSDNKPTLVFCSTRKSVQQAAGVLVNDSKYILNHQHRERLVRTANSLRDSKLRELVLSGVGYHHAGLELADRKAIEDLFTASDLPVLFATSTLAMGVNLPAHLVVIKSTSHYQMGSVQEYSDTQVLQMIGRAGRPQFDTSATAVIMTKTCNKFKYEALIGGTQLLESSLHKHLIEHLNAEVCLKTISDVTVALEWMRSTLLYIRVMKNPKHYDMPVGLTRNQVEKRLQDLCIRNLNLLAGIDLIKMDEDHFDIKTTDKGQMMARYCMAYTTMKQFSQLSPTTSLSEMLTVLSSCQEFADIQLRVTERRTLNMLNKDKNRATIRFPMSGKIKSKDMKVNCLMQAQLGSLTVQDFALSQDIIKIFRVAQRVTRCLVEFLWDKNHFQTLLTAVLLCKCVKSRLWENSKYITKQLEGIGPALSNAFVNAGIISFQKIEETNPRELELIVNRHPPFGNQLRDTVSKLPKYELSIEQVAKYNSVSAELAVTVCLANPESVQSNKVGYQHFSVLLIGDEDNKVVLKAKLSDRLLVKEGSWRRRITVDRANKGNSLDVHLISEDWVGLDVQSAYTPYYTGTRTLKHNTPEDDFEQCESSSSCTNAKTAENLNHRERATPRIEDERRLCFHRCLNKAVCGHECCKTGIPVSNRRSVKAAPGPARTEPKAMNSYMDNLRTKTQSLSRTPNLKRIKPGSGHISPDVSGCLDRFAYTPRLRLPLAGRPADGQPTAPVAPVTPRTPTGWEALDVYTRHREECQDNQDTELWTDDTLPDLIPGKLNPPYLNMQGQISPVQITEWDSDGSGEYGNFGLLTPPQPVTCHPVYTPEDFQLSGEEDDVCVLPTLTRHPRYQRGQPHRNPQQPHHAQQGTGTDMYGGMEEPFCQGTGRSGGLQDHGQPNRNPQQPHHAQQGTGTHMYGGMEPPFRQGTGRSGGFHDHGQPNRNPQQPHHAQQGKGTHMYGGMEEPFRQGTGRSGGLQDHGQPHHNPQQPHHAQQGKGTHMYGGMEEPFCQGTDGSGGFHDHGQPHGNTNEQGETQQGMYGGADTTVAPFEYRTKHSVYGGTEGTSRQGAYLFEDQGELYSTTQQKLPQRSGHGFYGGTERPFEYYTWNGTYGDTETFHCVPDRAAVFHDRGPMLDCQGYSCVVDEEDHLSKDCCGGHYNYLEKSKGQVRSVKNHHPESTGHGDHVMSKGHGQNIECYDLSGSRNTWRDNGDYQSRSTSTGSQLNPCGPAGWSSSGKRGTTEGQTSVNHAAVGHVRANHSPIKMQQQPLHKQGQVFAWQVPAKKADLTNDYVRPKGDTQSQDSQSSSPSVPRVREFVFAKQVHEENMQHNKPDKARFLVKPRVPVKCSPSFSSDGDDDVIASCLDDIEHRYVTVAEKNTLGHQPPLVSCDVTSPDSELEVDSGTKTHPGPSADQACEEKKTDVRSSFGVYNEGSEDNHDQLLSEVAHKTEAAVDRLEISGLATHPSPLVLSRKTQVKGQKENVPNPVGQDRPNDVSVVETITQKTSPLLSQTRDFFLEQESSEEKATDFTNIFDDIF